MLSKKELFETLSDGYSVQSKTANQFWLVLLVVSVITLTASTNKTASIDLPFTLGTVGSIDFYAINVILISTISIAFTSAMIQVLRTRLLLQKIIEDTKENDRFIDDIHMQDILDSILVPTYNRVGPIALFILGKKQFLSSSKKKSFMKFPSKVFYYILKISTFIVLYLIPAYSIRKSFIFINNTPGMGTTGLPYWTLICIVTLASLSLFILVIGDFFYAKNVLKRISK